MSESFSEFKNSFSYGTRPDMSFKFFKHLSEEETAVFIQTLFQKIIAAMDDGDWTAVSQHIIDGQMQAYDQEGKYTYDEGPLTSLPKPVSELKVGLLTSSGHFVEGDDPQPFGVENMSQEEAVTRIKQFLREKPRLSTIPVDTPPEQLRVRHAGYDVRGARADANVVLPLRTLQKMRAEGIIGDLHHEAYSFMGTCAQTPLRKEIAPQWATMLKEQGIDVLLLVPV